VNDVPITILTAAELRQCVELDMEVIDAVADGFTALSAGRVLMPPVLHMDLPEAHGEVDVEAAYVSGLPSFALKVSPDFFDSPRLGLPSVSGLMMLLSASTGRLEALLLDNGYLTDVRTAAAGAVAARHLARADARIAGVIGAGTQARLQMEALAKVRAIERILVWARDGAKADACADDLTARLGLEAIAVNSAERLVLEADAVVTTTPARDPLVVADWLHPGLHITAIGSDAPDKNELHPALLERADLLVCDARAQCARLGELHHALEQGLQLPTTELGEITDGARPGRTADDQITVCDLTGTGVQDAAIALLAWRRAVAQGFGLTIDD
jgi:ectoine utilization protein EutC